MENIRKYELSETEFRHETYVDTVTQNKIHKHLTDINDTISAQDILNINTNISSSNLSKAGNNAID